MPKSTRINVIYSMKEPCLNKEEFQYFNFSHSEMVDIVVSKKFKEGMMQAKEAMDRCKGAHNHYFGYFLIKFLGSYVFPSYWFQNKIGALLADMP